MDQEKISPLTGPELADNEIFERHRIMSVVEQLTQQWKESASDLQNNERTRDKLNYFKDLNNQLSAAVKRQTELFDKWIEQELNSAKSE
jgi:hypothetical protein